MSTFFNNIPVRFAIIVALLMIASVAGRAENGSRPDKAPEQAAIYYQGVLIDDDGAALPDGSYTIAFAFYDASEGGRQIWKEELTVRVENGEFIAALGSTTPLNLTFDHSSWLDVSVRNSDVSVARTEFMIPSDGLDVK